MQTATTTEIGMDSFVKVLKSPTSCAKLHIISHIKVRQPPMQCRCNTCHPSHGLTKRFEYFVNATVLCCECAATDVTIAEADQRHIATLLTSPRHALLQSAMSGSTVVQATNPAANLTTPYPPKSGMPSSGVTCWPQVA